MATASNNSKYVSSSAIKIHKGIRKVSLKIKTTGVKKKMIIPVIFIPGIFASRLESNGNDYLWDPDNLSGLMKYYTQGYVTSMTKGAADWSDKEIMKKISRMHSDGRVMTGHDIETEKSIKSDFLQNKLYKQLLKRHMIDRFNLHGNDPIKLLKLREAEYQRRNDRGWFQILDEYKNIMTAISTEDHPDCHFPVFGFGYNWRDDITNSGADFAKYIRKVISISDFPEYGKLDTHYTLQPTPKAIIVTHSMGSIVSRYASEEVSAKNNIHSIIHLNQPTTGAPILYRRFLFGSKDEKSHTGILDNVFMEILGTTSYHFASMTAPMIGPLQLLPTNEHVSDVSNEKFKWLKLNHQFINKPITDIYKDVYKSDAIGLLGAKRFSKDGVLKPYTKEEFMRVKFSDKDTGKIRVEWLSKVKPADYLHDKNHKLFDNIPTYREDSYRLRDKPTGDLRNSEKVGTIFEKVNTNIDKAKKFHSTLKLQYHDVTYVGRSKGVDTVNEITLDLMQGINSNFNLHSSMVKSKEGDGTVPLTSEEILIREGASPAGGVIDKGNTVHSKIPDNQHAIDITIEKIKVIVDGVLTKSANNKLTNSNVV